MTGYCHIVCLTLLFVLCLKYDREARQKHFWSQQYDLLSRKFSTWVMPTGYAKKGGARQRTKKKKKKSLGIFWSQIEDNDLLSARKYFFFFFFGIRWSSEFIRNALKIPYAMEIMPALWEAALLILMNYFCPSFITFNIFKFKKCKRRKKKKKRRKRSSYGQLRECSKQETVHDRLL